MSFFLNFFSFCFFARDRYSTRIRCLYGRYRAKRTSNRVFVLRFFDFVVWFLILSFGFPFFSQLCVSMVLSDRICEQSFVVYIFSTRFCVLVAFCSLLVSSFSFFFFVFDCVSRVLVWNVDLTNVSSLAGYRSFTKCSEIIPKVLSDRWFGFKMCGCFVWILSKNAFDSNRTLETSDTFFDLGS